MESLKLKLLAPACCPNCGYDLQPDNAILPVKMMHAEGTPETIVGLFNYVKPMEPPKAPKWPRSRTSRRGRRSRYDSKSQVKEKAGERTREGRGRSRDQYRKPKSEPETGPAVNPIQKRLLEIASKEATPEPAPTKGKTPERGASETSVPAVDTVKDEPKQPCSQYSQHDVDKFLTEFLADIEAQKTGERPQLSTEPPAKLSWKGFRVLKPEHVALQSGDPPIYDPFNGLAQDPRTAATPVSAPINGGQVVAIHNHFYGETVVVPDTP